MTLFKITIHNRNYSSWSINADPNPKVVLNPLKEKLFSKDTFTVKDYQNTNTNANSVQIVHSPIRSGIPIAAVLILLGNKTFGRHNKNKLLYKCIPNDTSLPIFLVPYEMKNVGFSKVFKNMYVTISFHEWTDKHQMGFIQQVIGSVDDLTSFYEYQLYCKELNHSINKFQKDVSKAFKHSVNDAFIENIKHRYPSIQNRTEDPWYIFSIDPSGSLDFDDAFSIRDTMIHNISVKQISIYISNVSIWIDILNLWDSFTRRVSTIYLPDKKRPMMPAALCDGICSLQQNATRIALTMDIYLADGVIVKKEFCNAFIKVRKNYCYEEACLLTDPHYDELLREVSKMPKMSLKIIDSHELVSSLMIFMNHSCACELVKHRSKGIFRKTIPSTTILESTVPDLQTFAGSYVEFSDSLSLTHEALGLDAYVHITSPIRRMVDLLNSIAFQQLVMGFHELSREATAFYDKWAAELEYINVSTRDIRKIQSDCELLHLYLNKTDMLTTVFDGYLLELIENNNNNSNNSDNPLLCYSVYLPKLKLFSQTYVPKDSFDNANTNTLQKFQLFLFQDEERFRKKIRVQLLL